MHYPRFLAANAIGGVLWATGFTLLGYFLGSAYKQVLSESTWAAAGFVALVIAVLVGLRMRARVRERRLEKQARSDARSSTDAS
jgi:membrane protein DedA with SNARE-associated domain